MNYHRRSPEATTQLRKHLVARDKLNLAMVNLSDATFNLNTPRLLDIRIGGSVKGLYQRKRKVGAFNFGRLRSPLLQLCQGV
jgi:hypothetical protein